MTTRTVALFHSRWPDHLERPPSSRPWAQYRYAIWYRANPRTVTYMRALLEQRIPNAVWLDTRDERNWAELISGADRIVLIYPDSIGLGFAGIERKVFAGKRAWAGMEVLNGRGRMFRLNAATRIGLCLRRCLEWTLLPEFAFIPVFVLVTPVLWAIDALRGHR